MKYAKVQTAVVQGLSIKKIMLEISLIQGLHKFEISGINRRKGQEMYARVRTALLNNGFQIPNRIIICHLSEEIQNIPDYCLDLALACAILIADEQIQVIDKFKNQICLFGGLGLSGEINGVKGVYAMLNHLKLQYLLIPKANQEELAFSDLQQIQRIYPVYHINEAVDILNGKNLEHYRIGCQNIQKEAINSTLQIMPRITHPLAELAIETAVAGWHPLLIVGSPDSDMPFLKRYAAGLLPVSDDQAYARIRSIYSIKGLWRDVLKHKEMKAFMSPDFNINKQELFGDNKNLLPGIITLANLGILFLEELNLFKIEILRLLKKPMNEQCIQLGSKNNQQIYPADFLLLATMKPCPCGYYFEEDQRCQCKKHEITNYKKKIKSTILNQFQMQIVLKYSAASKGLKAAFRPTYTLQERQKKEERILKARNLQKTRCEAYGITMCCNSQISAIDIPEIFRLSQHTLNQFELQLKETETAFHFYQNLIRVARTIADLQAEKDIQLKHLQKAMIFRVKPDIY